MANRLYDPRRSDTAITCERFSWSGGPTEPPRTNCFSIYWIEAGSGSVDIDLAASPYASPSLVFTSPYRRVRFVPTAPTRGRVIRFHANFLCVETFHAESGCSGALFNDPYGSPVLPLATALRPDVRALVTRVEAELDGDANGRDDLVIAALKILLVLATRAKQAADETRPSPRAGGDHRHPLRQQIADLVEAHYREFHTPAEYAARLHMTPKALGHVTQAQFGRTMTALIRERLLIDAKWDLLHTLKPVKQVAHELGFDDELYFSRFFRKATGQSPTGFRDFETAIRGGSNLSMSLARPTIPRP